MVISQLRAPTALLPGKGPPFYRILDGSQMLSEGGEKKENLFRLPGIELCRLAHKPSPYTCSAIPAPTNKPINQQRSHAVLKLNIVKKKVGLKKY